MAAPASGASVFFQDNPNMGVSASPNAHTQWRQATTGQGMTPGQGAGGNQINMQLDQGGDLFLPIAGSFLSRYLDQWPIAGNFENITPASTAIAFNPAVLIHRINAAGTGTITTITGGVEGQRAILMLAVAGVTLTQTNTDTVSTIHLNATGTGTVVAPTSIVTTNLTSLIPMWIGLVCTANMPGFAALQWFQTQM